MVRFYVLLGGLICIIISQRAWKIENVKYGTFIIIIIINAYPFVPYVLILPINTSYFLDVGPSFLPPCLCSCYSSPWKPLHKLCHLPIHPEHLILVTKPETTMLDPCTSSFLSHTSQTSFKISWWKLDRQTGQNIMKRQKKKGKPDRRNSMVIFPRNNMEKRVDTRTQTQGRTGRKINMLHFQNVSAMIQDDSAT